MQLIQQHGEWTVRTVQDETPKTWHRGINLTMEVPEMLLVAWEIRISEIKSQGKAVIRCAHGKVSNPCAYNVLTRSPKIDNSAEVWKGSLNIGDGGGANSIRRRYTSRTDVRGINIRVSSCNLFKEQALQKETIFCGLERTVTWMPALVSCNKSLLEEPNMPKIPLQDLRRSRHRRKESSLHRRDSW